jgi:hypothetical protein
VKKIITVFLLSISTLFSPAQAANDSTTYIGLQVGSIDADNDSLEVDIDYGMIRLGIMPNDNVAFEYRIATGTSDDEENGITVDLENVYGLYGLYHFNFSENASVYGALGYSQASFKTTIGNASDQDDENGFSYGVGAQVYGFNVEYMQYLDTTDLDVAAFAVGYNYKF